MAQAIRQIGLKLVVFVLRLIVRSAPAGWRRSTYHDKRVVLSSPNKVHLLVDYSRDGEGGAVLSRHANLWIVTFEDGRWGVKQRSY